MITFRYKKEISARGPTIIYRPVADVALKSNSGAWIEFNPYIDSGADFTLIPLSLGKLLGFSYKNMRSEKIGGISGSISAINMTIPMRIGIYEFPAKISWALIEDVPPLLGRSDVFDQFEICFKQWDKIVVFDKR